jgi:hypothetical protein
MTWWAEDDAQDTTFHCVNILTGEFVSLADEDQTGVDSGDQSIAGSVRQSQPRGEAGDRGGARPGADPG